MSTPKKRGADFVSSMVTAGQTAAATAPPTAGATGRSDVSVPVLGMAARLAGGELDRVRNERDALQAQVAELLENPDRISRIDPKVVTHTIYRDRHDRGFEDAEFGELKRKIQAAGRNEQAVLLRPASAKNKALGFEYEIVYGHRRHRAVLELGLELRAVIAEVDDRTLVVLMTHENEDRSNLSQYEKAKKYQLWIETGIYESMGDIAKALEIDKSTVSRVMSINQLPDEVVSRLYDPRKITPFWTKEILKGWEADTSGARERLEKLTGNALSLKQALHAVAPPDGNGHRSFNVGAVTLFKSKGQVVDGNTVYKHIELSKALDETQAKRLVDFLASL